MGRLFWKIFLWFWVTMILMTLGIAWGMAQFFHKEGNQLSKPIAQLAMPQVLAVSSVLSSSGESAAKALLQEMVESSPLQVLVVDDQGQELLGQSIPKASGSDLVNQNIVVSSVSPQEHFDTVTERLVVSPDGRHYRIIAGFSTAHRPQRPLRHVTSLGPLGPLARNPWLLSMRLGIALLVSGLVCFWLAWYLAKPVRRLREASQRLSEGELDARVASSIGRRRDEIADLGRDFDHMAERLQALVSAQKQLLSDISHELRSPLARLQVALGLARKKNSEQVTPELDRIEREANRLDELVSQVLTLARLEAGGMDAKEDYVDVTALLEDIAQDAEFEAVGHNRHIHLSCTASPVLKANAELLHRALENIIRNAMHYTANDTQVEVCLCDNPERKGWLKISVCDRGAGVPDDRLPTLFEPFVRISESRNRKSGGYGLGLAIAKRAIQLHGGDISAKNISGEGLCLSIHLPVRSEV
jgi:two-component system sensor histidine kinase CpxA